MKTQSLLEDLRAKSAAQLAAAEGVIRAQEEVQRAKDNLRAAAIQRHESFAAAVKGLLVEWMLEKTGDMTTIAEEYAFANELGDALRAKWSPCSGSAEEEKKRMDWLQDLGLEVFGNYLDVLTKEPDETIDATAFNAEEIRRSRAYRLICDHLGDALRERYVAISGVWRADPADPFDWRKRDTREHSWRIALREHPTRYVKADVWRELLAAGRVKENGMAWAKFSKSEWSFKNSATIDADIAKAHEAVCPGGAYRTYAEAA